MTKAGKKAQLIFLNFTSVKTKIQEKGGIENKIQRTRYRKKRNKNKTNNDSEKKDEEENFKKKNKIVDKEEIKETKEEQRVSR